jgi:Kef-type K+ transport system membrane component KefB
MNAIDTKELFLIALVIIFTIPFLIWRLGKTEYYSPLVVVQIITGIVLGPGILGSILPEYYNFVFNPQVIQTLNGIANWGVMIFVWIAGIELSIQKTWVSRRESGITVVLALGIPFLFGGMTAGGMLMYPGWIGEKGIAWQFIVSVGMACAITALPILILFMEKLEILREPIGQRILRYASLDDLATWIVLACIQMDLLRLRNQFTFLIGYILIGIVFRKLMVRLAEIDRWFIGFIWLTLCAVMAEWAGLHFMVGAFLAGVIIDNSWFDQKSMDLFRHHVLIAMMPVFFLTTGLRTDWNIGVETVFLMAAILLIASAGGKLLGVYIAGKLLKWNPSEASLIGWLLQTKALIMIIFANILLDKQIITSDTFTALLLMAVVSTMLSIPMASYSLERVNANMIRANVRLENERS